MHRTISRSEITTLPLQGDVLNSTGERTVHICDLYTVICETIDLDALRGIGDNARWYRSSSRKSAQEYHTPFPVGEKASRLQR